MARQKRRSAFSFSLADCSVCNVLDETVNTPREGLDTLLTLACSINSNPQIRSQTLMNTAFLILRASIVDPRYR
jgi:hypothetical protein